MIPGVVVAVVTLFGASTLEGAGQECVATYCGQDGPVVAGTSTLPDQDEEVGQCLTTYCGEGHYSGIRSATAIKGHAPDEVCMTSQCH